MTSRQTHSLQQAARLLGRTRGTVSGWLADGCPHVSAARRGDGVEWQLSLPDVVGWLIQRAVAAERERLTAQHQRETERLRLALAQAGDDAEPISRPEALRRSAVARARLDELALAERERALAPVDEVAEEAARAMTIIRDRLLALPTALAPALAAAADAPRCFVLLDAALREALDAIADAADAADELIERVLGPAPDAQEE